MKLQPSGTSTLGSLADVSLTNVTPGDFLFVNPGGTFVNGTLDAAGVVETTGAQNVAGVKTFTDNLEIDNQKSLLFYETDANGSDFLAFKAPASVTTSTTWILPNGDGTVNQVIRTDGAGNLSFLSVDDIFVIGFDKDEIARLIGRSGGQLLRGGVSASENLVLDSTNSTTKGTVQIASGSPLELINQNEVRFRELAINGTNYVALKAPASLTSNLTLTLPGVDGAADSVLKTNGAGVLSFDSSFILGTGKAGGQSIAGGIAASETLTLESTTNATKGTVDVLGDSVFRVLGSATAVGEMRFLELTGNGTNFVALKSADAIAANFTLTLPDADGLADDVLVTDGSGVLSFSSDYAKLLGRVGGQTLIGGTTVSNDLILESTSSSTKGAVQIAGGTVFELKGGPTQEGRIRLYEDSNNGTNFTEIQPVDSIASDHTYTLPPAPPASDGFNLFCTAAGAWSWGAPVGGVGATITIKELDGTPTNTAVDTLTFDQSTGLKVSTLSASNMLIELEQDAVPTDRLVPGTSGQVMVTTGGLAASFEDFNLDDIKDVSAAGPSDGQHLEFDFASSTWIATDPPGAVGVFRHKFYGPSVMVPRATNGATKSQTEFITNDINLEYFLFDGTTEESIQIAVVLPDEWDRLDIKVKLQWEGSSGATPGDGVTWGVRGVALSNDEPIDTALGTEVTINDTLLAVGDMHVSPATAAVTIGGTPALEDFIILQISRKPSSGGDTMTEDAKLFGIQIQYKESASEPVLW